MAARPPHRSAPPALATTAPTSLSYTLSNCMNIFLISRVHQRPASIIHTATNNQSLPVYQLTRSTQSFAQQTHCIQVLHRVVILKSAQVLGVGTFQICRVCSFGSCLKFFNIRGISLNFQDQKLITPSPGAQKRITKNIN